MQNGNKKNRWNLPIKRHRRQMIEMSSRRQGCTYVIMSREESQGKYTIWYEESAGEYNHE